MKSLIINDNYQPNGEIEFIRVVYDRVNDLVWFNEKENYILAIFDVNENYSTMPILGSVWGRYFDITQIDSIEIEGNKIEPTSSYTFTTYGDVQVKYHMNDNFTNTEYMFSGTGAKIVDLSQCDLSNVTNMSGMFYFEMTENEPSNDSIETFTIGEQQLPNLTDISSMFNGCRVLSNVPYDLLKCVTSIDNATFQYCDSLTNVIIPNNITSIGYSAFGYCENLKSVTFEEGSQLTSIDSYAFNDCTILTSITIPSSVTSIGDGAFKGCTFTLDSFNNKSSLNAEENNYWGATIVDEITEDGLYIKDNVVIKCRSNATSVIIPSSVTSIGEDAFEYCSRLTSVTFAEGSQCTSIGNDAFYNCSKLTSITCLATTAPSIDNYTFRFIASNGVLKVPQGSDYSSWMSTSSYYLGYYNWTIEYV